MSEHITAKGLKYVLRDIEDVPEYLRRAVAAEMERALEEGESPLARMAALDDRMIEAMVLSWSLDVPVSGEAAVKLGKGDYAHIRTEVAPFLTQMFPDFGPDTVDDPESPSSP